LIDFTFGNFRSFRDEATLSMIAAEGLPAKPEVTERNVIPNVRPGLDLLRVAAIYGANASGKSNVIKAFRTFRRAVTSSADSSYRFEGVSFLLDTVSDKKTMSFQLTFIHEQKQWRYGFEVFSPDDEHKFTSEWLFAVEDNSEQCLFLREEDNVTLNGFAELDSVLDNGKLTRSESLLLSLASLIPKNKTSASLVHAIQKNNHISGLDDDSLRRFTEQSLEHENFSGRVTRLLIEADTGITDIGVLENGQDILERIVSAENVSDDRRKQIREAASRHFKIVTFRPVFDETGHETDTVVPMPLFTAESEGTKKLFAYSAPLLDKLDRGGALFIDEIDARLHPLLTRSLIQLFQSPNTNPNNAQLIGYGLDRVS
jgi:uncharacterized protein